MKSSRLFVLFSLVCLIAAGLMISRVNQASARISTVAAPTFSKDVAPIFAKSCMNCHRPGEIAPMSFMNYKEVRPWAKAIREKVVNREMPPWHADPAHGEWSNDRRLAQKDIDGGLIGGASLEARSFIDLVKAADAAG